MIFIYVQKKTNNIRIMKLSILKSFNFVKYLDNNENRISRESILCVINSYITFLNENKLILLHFFSNLDKIELQFL